MKNSTFHRFAVSSRDRRKNLQLIATDWVAPIIACLAVLAISLSIIAAMLGER